MMVENSSSMTDSRHASQRPEVSWALAQPASLLRYLVRGGVL